MASENQTYRFDQLHIDVARNSTDDFNPFHDPQRWQRIAGNPFHSTIALGFQTEFLVSHLIHQRRQTAQEAEKIAACDLYFSNYEFRFAGALRPGDIFEVDIRNTLDKTTKDGGLSNRVVVRKYSGDLVLMGTQSETAEPRFLPDVTLRDLPPLDQLPDRIPVPGSTYFLKRKFLNTSNGKNFALAGLADQHEYFDELEDRVSFPPMFTAALSSCALLEKAWREGYDFEKDPLVYTSHQISIDRLLQRKLRSNDKLHMLVEGPIEAPPAKGLGKAAIEQSLYRCFGLVHGHQILFRANVMMAPLHAMLDKTR